MEERPWTTNHQPIDENSLKNSKKKTSYWGASSSHWQNPVLSCKILPQVWYHGEPLHSDGNVQQHWASPSPLLQHLFLYIDGSSYMWSRQHIIIRIITAVFFYLDTMFPQQSIPACNPRALIVFFLYVQSLVCTNMHWVGCENSRLNNVVGI
jgi:hypothetical protein